MYTKGGDQFRFFGFFSLVSLSWTLSGPHREVKRRPHWHIYFACDARVRCTVVLHSSWVLTHKIPIPYGAPQRTLRKSKDRGIQANNVPESMLPKLVLPSYERLNIKFSLILVDDAPALEVSGIVSFWCPIESMSRRCRPEKSNKIVRFKHPGNTSIHITERPIFP